VHFKEKVMMKITISSLWNYAIHLICLVLTYLFAQSLEPIWSYLILLIYSSWIFGRIARNRVQIADLLVLLFIMLLAGQNFLLYAGLVLTLIYSISQMHKMKRLIFDREEVAFLVMCLCGFLSSFFNSIDSKSANLYIGVYFLLLCLVLGLGFMRKCCKLDSDKSILIFSWVSFILGLGYFMTHTISELFSTAHIFVYYISNYSVYSNTLTGIMAPFAFGSAIILIKTKEVLPRILSALGLIMMSMIILAVQSRGTYLGILVAILWIIAKNKKSKVVIWVTIIGIVCVFVSFFIPDEFFSMFFGRFRISHFANRDFSNGRIESYVLAWDMFKSHPIIGCGFWQFSAYGINFGDPHNFILAYLASTGLIGFGGFIFFLVSIYKRIERCYSQATDLYSKVLAEVSMSTLMIYCSHGLVEPSLTTSAPLTIFIIMTSMSYINVNIREKSNLEG